MLIFIYLIVSIESVFFSVIQNTNRGKNNRKFKKKKKGPELSQWTIALWWHILVLQILRPPGASDEQTQRKLLW